MSNVERALISVSDKTGIVEFAQALADNDISRIDLVVVNLYPFEATVANPDCSLEDAIENIDIGGPTMVRSAAKNNASVGIVTNASDYQRVLDDMAAHNGALSDTLRFDLAIKAFEHTAAYDSAIANYFGKKVGENNDDFPRTINLNFEKTQNMRYGENPHQKAAFYHRHRDTAAGQGTKLQQHCGYRRRTGMRKRLHQAGLRDRQTRQPLWCGGQPGWHYHRL